MQLRGGEETVLGLGPERLVEQLHPTLAALPGAVHGRFGILEHALRSRVCVGDHDAEAGGHPHLVRVDEPRLGERAEDAHGDLLDLVCGDVVAHDDELVSAEPGNGVARSDRLGDAVGGVTQ